MARWQELEQAIEDLLKFVGFKFHRVKNYRCFKCGQVQNSGASDFPDFYIYYPIKLYIEAKTGRGKLTPGQTQFREDVESTGEKYLVCKNNIDALLKVLRQGKYL